ncbi:type VI secretion system tube protein TssD [Citrobacter rodentium]|uniref:Hcp family T6SS protein CtsH3 n=2 Tax=Citrobacter rodentium TaxID=67825 RepID=D2TLJ9_CITRI|nr:type VI secretion system tube protein TssD [Citrobacter rodentium]QBY30654.1 type VI secretion system tube protein Hcp [Citrobacter rodentium]UHO31976.1 type VI secretion system tube protein Hcp [Citrobacter rodentium NBRC 105723 = DSM 16636]CBG91079.1 Hcp family T6SS protein CtsH3 [Citrobacter rodentium ICC168]HAT8011293.1 type VI secretion system tube protein Hcp [Citrobacter rodentium NBRC 105723 = DSM 16636]HAT8016108.1 type VI secretion system tube protein Hcp [Citrobacter rodentium]
MSDIVYLTISGEQQGTISNGCGTSASVGNHWQSGHEDEILAFSLSNSTTSTGHGCQLHGLRFCKQVDKSTPLFARAINNNEQLYLEFYFYRTNHYGHREKYYYIQLRGAFLSGIHYLFSENNIDTETITVSYEYILCKHLIANTEYSFLALPTNYNHLFVPRQDSGFQTLNTKGVGRLLAAGGIYNGNVEGFRDTAEKLGGNAPAGYDQILNKRTKGSIIALASIASAFGLRRPGLLREVEKIERFKHTDIIATTNQNYRAIAAGVETLSIAQKKILTQLPDAGSRTIVTKRFGQNDLGALSAATGDEFAMFTTGGRRLIIRGDATGVPIGAIEAEELAVKGWRWSSHVHPDGTLRSSTGDRAILSIFKEHGLNKKSAIIDPYGRRFNFSPDGDLISSDWRP